MVNNYLYLYFIKQVELKDIIMVKTYSAVTFGRAALCHIMTTYSQRMSIRWK